MRLIGYARVSTLDQDTRLQRDALARAGVIRVHSEACSGVGLRPVLRQVLDGIQPGEVLVVWKIDRIARGLPDLLRIVDRLKLVGAGLRSLTEPMDTTSPYGEFVLQMLGAVAQLERSMIRERSIAGQVAAIQRGAVFGRPKALPPEKEIEVFARWLCGETKSALARHYGVSLIVIRRICDEQTGRKKTGVYPVLGKYLQ